MADTELAHWERHAAAAYRDAGIVVPARQSTSTARLLRRMAGSFEDGCESGAHPGAERIEGAGKGAGHTIAEVFPDVLEQLGHD